jgi:DNA polymerase phi
LDANGVWLFLDTLEATFMAPIDDEEHVQPSAMEESGDEDDAAAQEDDAAASTKEDAQTQASTRRVWVCNQLLMLVRGGRIPLDDRCVGRILGMLLYHGFYSSAVNCADESKSAQKQIKSAQKQWKSAFIDTNPTATHILKAVQSAAVAGLSLSDEVCQVAAQRFFSVLSELHQVRHSGASLNNVPAAAAVTQKQQQQQKRHSGTASDNELWVYHLTVVWRKLVSVSAVTPIHASTDEFDSASEVCVKQISSSLWVLVSARAS